MVALLVALNNKTAWLVIDLPYGEQANVCVFVVLFDTAEVASEADIDCTVRLTTEAGHAHM